MECLACDQLIKDFNEATTRYSVAVDLMSVVANSNDHKDHELQTRRFFEAQAIARREFDNCRRARTAVEKHRRSAHRRSPAREAHRASAGAMRR